MERKMKQLCWEKKSTGDFEKSINPATKWPSWQQYIFLPGNSFPPSDRTQQQKLIWANRVNTKHTHTHTHEGCWQWMLGCLCWMRTAGHFLLGLFSFPGPKHPLWPMAGKERAKRMQSHNRLRNAAFTLKVLRIIRASRSQRQRTDAYGYVWRKFSRDGSNNGNDTNWAKRKNRLVCLKFQYFNIVILLYIYIYI